MALDRRDFLKTGTATAALLATGCAPKPEAVADGGTASAGVMDQLSAIKDRILTAYPENATSYGVDTGPLAHLKTKLTDRTMAGQAGIADMVRATKAELAAIDTSSLTEDEKLHVDVVATVFDTAADGFAYPYGDVATLNSQWSYRNTPYAVAQNVGAFVEIPTMLDTSHQIDTAEDVEAYVERMGAYAAQIDGETERAVADSQRGVVLPSFLMAKTLGQLRRGLAADSADWGIVQSVVSRGQGVAPDIDARALAVADEVIRPAIARQIAALEEIAPTCTDEAGVWKLPDGAAYYDWNLKASTTTTMTADEIHEMGKAELAELHAKMDPILRSIGYTEGSVGTRMTALADDPRYQFADGDAGRAEIMAFIEEKVSDIRARMPQAFETLVPGFLEVTRIPPEVEAGAPGAYGGAGTVDGKQPGHFWINLRTPKLHSKYSLPDLTYHEAIPGHVWQGEYTFKQPLIRSLLMFNAYSEGWALYAEQIADELGVYDDFPVGRLGYFQSLAFRACRLVVDTGLHAKRWTREEAINWFVENNGSNPDEVQSEVDRYCAWPGQACGYKVGHTAINRLRDRAQGELGDQFDYRRFNDALVLGGAVPMTVLGRVIDEYIARERG